MHENNTYEKIKNTLRVFAQQYNVPCISSATEHYLIQYLMKYKPLHCLEIGSAIGYSTFVIASYLQKRNGSLTSFEISHPSYMMACHQLFKWEIFNTKLYHSNFLQTPLEKLIKKTSLDFVFIDGAKREYAPYLKKILPYCKPHATIICDDVIKFHQKIHPIYDILQKHNLTHQIIQLEEDDGILEIKNGWRQ